MSYGAVAAIKGISLAVAPGEVVALLGANGAGKSTMLAHHFRADPAARRLDPLRRRSVSTGRRRRGSCASASPIARKDGGSSARCRSRENLRLGAAARIDRAAIEEDRERIFELFPILRERMHQQAGTLSGGEQQMLALARALMAGPKLLLLDEPSLGLAPIVIQSIFRTLAELKAAGVAMLLVEQNISLALDLADRAYVLRTGEVTLSGSAEALRADYEEVAAAYLGARPMSTSLYVTQQVINAIALGSLYALVAIGLSMVFGILRMANFAHGDMMMVGAFATLVIGALGVPFGWRRWRVSLPARSPA